MLPGLLSRRVALGALLLGLAACQTTRQRYHCFQPAQARDLAYLRPVVSMTLLVRGDENRPDPWFSAHMATRLQQALQQQATALHLQAQPVAADSARQDALRREVERAAAMLSQAAASPYPEALPTVEEALAGQPGRYVLLLLGRGYMRTPENYMLASRKYMRESPILTNDPQVVGPAYSQVGLYALVYDREQHHIVYFGHQRSSSDELLKDAVLVRKVQQLLGPDFGSPAATAPR